MKYTKTIAMLVLTVSAVMSAATALVLPSMTMDAQALNVHCDSDVSIAQDSDYDRDYDRDYDYDYDHTTDPPAWECETISEADQGHMTNEGRFAMGQP